MNVDYPDDDVGGAIDTLRRIRAQTEQAEDYPFGVSDNYCFWCDMKLHKSLFDEIYALNAVYPEFCPWCGKKINYKF